MSHEPEPAGGALNTIRHHKVDATMFTLAIILGLAALAIAIWSAVKPANILWIAVVLLSILVIIDRIPLR